MSRTRQFANKSVGCTGSFIAGLKQQQSTTKSLVVSQLPFRGLLMKLSLELRDTRNINKQLSFEAATTFRSDRNLLLRFSLMPFAKAHLGSCKFVPFNIPANRQQTELLHLMIAGIPKEVKISLHRSPVERPPLEEMIFSLHSQRASLSSSDIRTSFSPQLVVVSSSS